MVLYIDHGCTILNSLVEGEGVFSNLDLHNFLLFAEVGTKLVIQ